MSNYKLPHGDGRLSITLPGEVNVPVRPIRSDDVRALQQFHSRLSEQSIRLRFFGHIKELSDQKARYLAHIDGVDHFALVALDPDDPNQIIAAVRFDRERGTDRAEYATIVEDRWQGRGLGLRLTHQLIDEARERDIRYFYGLALPENERMLSLLRDLDLPERERREGGIRYVEVELGAA